MRDPLVLLFALVAPLAVAGSLAAQEAPRQLPPNSIVVEDLPGEGETGPASPVQATDQPDAREAEAQAQYADGNLQRARELYLELGAQHPEAGSRARHLITAAWLSFQLGDRLAALDQLTRALYGFPAAPFRPELYATEFATLFQDAQRDAAERRRRGAAERTALAVDAIRASRYEEARRALEEALVLAPDDIDVLYNLALVDLRQRRPDAALAGFERVLALERSRPEGLPRELESQALNNVAVLYFQKGDLEVARATLEEALGLAPDDARAWYNLGLVRQKLELPEESHAALRRARQLDRRDFDIAAALAISDIERGEWVEAVALLLEATRERPEDPQLWLQLGRAQRGLGNPDGALESFRNAIALDPANRTGIAVTAALQSAELRYARKQHADAAAAAGQVVAWRGDAVDGWMLLGLSRLALGELAGAREAMERARVLAPARADVAHNLGTVCLAQKDHPAAEAAFRAALELEPGNAEVRSVLDQLAARRAASEAAAAGKSGKRRPPPELGATLTVADYGPLGIRGLVVDAVAANGAAARAGLAVGDLILRVDGKAAESAERVRAQAAKRDQGVVLDLLRAGKPLQVRLKLD